MNQWMNQWMNEWMNERMNEFMNEGMNEWMNEMKRKRKETKRNDMKWLEWIHFISNLQMFWQPSLSLSMWWLVIIFDCSHFWVKQKFVFKPPRENSNLPSLVVMERRSKTASERSSNQWVYHKHDDQSQCLWTVNMQIVCTTSCMNT